MSGPTKNARTILAFCKLLKSHLFGLPVILGLPAKRVNTL